MKGLAPGKLATDKKISWDRMPIDDGRHQRHKVQDELGLKNNDSLMANPHGSALLPKPLRENTAEDSESGNEAFTKALEEATTAELANQVVIKITDEITRQVKDTRENLYGLCRP